jgi:cytosine/creatinine deaminase
MQDHERFLAAATQQARRSLATGGIPIGACLVINADIVAVGHNRRVQDGSVIRHAETDCLENAGRLPATAYAQATMYTTLSPCDMCTGAILLYKIPRVVIGENHNFLGSEELLRQRGVAVTVLDDLGCTQMMKQFIALNPTLWSEDIGVPGHRGVRHKS